MNYKEINKRVMSDTARQCTNNTELSQAIESSIKRQYMVAHEESIEVDHSNQSDTRYIVSGKRSFQAAREYKGKKVAVLNFANNHGIGGAPYSSGAQEESLCRCSTLLPCLTAMKTQFYYRHIDMFKRREINYMGNDDLIYTPDVVVFKTDELSDPIYPRMMKREDWFKVDIITSAAPELNRVRTLPSNYESIITSRIRKILDVAAKENVEVLILGAWGCGAFKNPSIVVARVFRDLLKDYSFETVEFPLSTHKDVSGSIFTRTFQ